MTAVNFANSDEKIDLAQAGFPAGAIAKFEGVVPSAWRLTEHLEMTEVAQPLPLFLSPVNKKAPACLGRRQLFGEAEIIREDQQITCAFLSMTPLSVACGPEALRPAVADGLPFRGPRRTFLARKSHYAENVLTAY